MGLLTGSEIALGISTGAAAVCFLGAISMAFHAIRRALDEVVSE